MLAVQALKSVMEIKQKRAKWSHNKCILEISNNFYFKKSAFFFWTLYSFVLAYKYKLFKGMHNIILESAAHIQKHITSMTKSTLHLYYEVNVCPIYSDILSPSIIKCNTSSHMVQKSVQKCLQLLDSTICNMVALLTNG